MVQLCSSQDVKFSRVFSLCGSIMFFTGCKIFPSFLIVWFNYVLHRMLNFPEFSHCVVQLCSSQDVKFSRVFSLCGSIVFFTGCKIFPSFLIVWFNYVLHRMLNFPEFSHCVVQLCSSQDVKFSRVFSLCGSIMFFTGC